MEHVSSFSAIRLVATLTMSLTGLKQRESNYATRIC